MKLVALFFSRLTFVIELAFHHQFAPNHVSSKGFLSPPLKQRGRVIIVISHPTMVKKKRPQSVSGELWRAIPVNIKSFVAKWMLAKRMRHGVSAKRSFGRVGIIKGQAFQCVVNSVCCYSSALSKQ